MAFLKTWIAIEILQMPDTNIAPIRDALSEIYNMKKNEVEEKFNVGRLFRLRGRIVHDGENINITSLFQSYIQFLFIDLLYWNLKIDNRKMALSLVEKSKLELLALSKK